MGKLECSSPRAGRKGFTIAELLVALMVSAIILAAVATLAYALGVANDASDDTSQKQAQVRYATLRISDLIRHCKLVCAKIGSDLAVWRADDNGNNRIDVLELVYIETGGNKISLLEFTSCPTGLRDVFRVLASQRSILEGVGVKDLLIGQCSERRTVLVPVCSNVQFALDLSPPQTKAVAILFDIVENGSTRRYQINAVPGAWAGHLLTDDTTSAEIVSGDDD